MNITLTDGHYYSINGLKKSVISISVYLVNHIVDILLLTRGKSRGFRNGGGLNNNIIYIKKDSERGRSN